MRMDRQSGFLWTIVRCTWTSADGRPWRGYLLGLLLIVSMALSARVYGGAAPAAAVVRPAGAPATEVDRLIERASRVEHLWHRVVVFYEREVAPIESVLLRYRNDPALARRIALSLVAEGRRAGLEPRLVLAVLLVENPWLEPGARSPVGARGLMQVMPQHEGNWPPCAPDLESVESNICHGTRIFAHYFRAEGGDIERALLRYNGCVRGTNTPDCHAYPYHVYARAGRASILAWLRPQPSP